MRLSNPTLLLHQEADDVTQRSCLLLDSFAFVHPAIRLRKNRFDGLTALRQPVGVSNG